MKKYIKVTKKLLGELGSNLSSLWRRDATDGLPFKVIPFPNGQAGELWIKSADGSLGFSIRISEGKAGLSLTVRRFIGMEPMTVHSDHPDAMRLGHHDVAEVSVCQYHSDERSLAFKRWYFGEATEDDIAILGPEYRRT